MDTDVATLGHRIRHFRTQRGLTLDELGAATGVAASQLSLIENGKREPRVTLLSGLAAALGVQLADLLSSEPPDERAALEIELARIQRGTLYGSLGLPSVKPTKGTPTEILDSLHDRFRLLTGGARTAVRRQQTLRASVDWSHALLTEPDAIEEDRRLAAFAGNGQRHEHEHAPPGALVLVFLQR